MFIDVLFFICGIYVLYSTIKMKKTGEIPLQLIGKKTDISRAKDIPGYINAMFPRNIIFGVILIIASILGLLYQYFALSVWLEAVAYIFYLAGIIFYSIVSIKYQKKYLMNY